MYDKYYKLYYTIDINNDQFIFYSIYKMAMIMGFFMIFLIPLTSYRIYLDKKRRMTFRSYHNRLAIFDSILINSPIAISIFCFLFEYKLYDTYFTDYLSLLIVLSSITLNGICFPLKLIVS